MPGGVEQLEDREVAHVDEAALPRAHLGHLKQQVDLRAVEIRRADTSRASARRRRAPGSRRRPRCDAGSDRSCAPPTACAPSSACRARASRDGRGIRASPAGRRPASVHALAAVVAAEEARRTPRGRGRRRERCSARRRAPSRGGRESRRSRGRRSRQRRRASRMPPASPRCEHRSRHSRHVAPARARRAARASARLSFTRVRQVVDEPEVRVHRLEVLRVGLAQIAVQRAEHRRGRRHTGASPREHARRG